MSSAAVGAGIFCKRGFSDKNLTWLRIKIYLAPRALPRKLMARMYSDSNQDELKVALSGEDPNVSLSFDYSYHRGNIDMQKNI